MFSLCKFAKTIKREYIYFNVVVFCSFWYSSSSSFFIDVFNDDVTKKMAREKFHLNEEQCIKINLVCGCTKKLLLHKTTTTTIRTTRR